MPLLQQSCCAALPWRRTMRIARRPAQAAARKRQGRRTSAPGKQPAAGRDAPVGHRQPRAKDVPPGIDQNLGVRSPEDEAIDGKLRICRDC